jgi:hypothetical protein
VIVVVVAAAAAATTAFAPARFVFSITSIST